jgi:transcription factor SPN1
MADEEIASLRQRMADAAEQDVQARSKDPPQPAMHKLRLLPEVVAMLNRNGREIENAIVDPENNLLESVRFFLEPLNDGSLPAYNIQRELFACLAKLPIGKDALVSSGIGKVVLFYTKSKKPEVGIKRQAERLLGEWTRPILKRSDDYRKRVLEEVDYDPSQNKNLPVRTAGLPGSQGETAAQKRERALAPPVKYANRARVDNKPMSYTVVPKSTNVQPGRDGRPMGDKGDAAFRRIKAKQQAAMGKGTKR